MSSVWDTTKNRSMIPTGSGLGSGLKFDNMDHMGRTYADAGQKVMSFMGPGGLGGDLLGVTNLYNSGDALLAGNYGEAVKQAAGAGLKIGSLFIGGPVGLGVRGLGATGRVLPAAAGLAATTGTYAAGDRLAPTGSINPTTLSTSGASQASSWERELARQGTVYGQTPSTPQERYRQQQMVEQERAQQMQNQMVEDINASFSPQQRLALQRQQGGEAAIPEWLRSMRSLSAEQQFEFERQEAAVRADLDRVRRETGTSRDRARTEFERRNRLIGQLGSTQLSDLRASLARRGMLGTAGGMAESTSSLRQKAQRAKSQADYSDLTQRLSEGEVEAAAATQRFLSDLAARRLAMESDQTRAYQDQYSQWLRGEI
jgi:hypothetical protein